MDYSFDDQHRLIHFKYDLAPQVLAKLSRTLPELLMHDGLVTCSFEWRNHPECEKLKTLAGEWVRVHFAGDIINISCDKLIGSDFDLLATMTTTTQWHYYEWRQAGDCGPDERWGVWWQ